MAQLSTKVRLYCKANSVDTVDFTKDVLLVQEAVSYDAICSAVGSSIDKFQL